MLRIQIVQHTVKENSKFWLIFNEELDWNVRPTVRKNCSSYWEKLLKFEAEGGEFAKFLRLLEQFIQTSERSEHFLVTECFFNLFLEDSHI